MHTRGPVDTDLPAYTLRGYRLHWTLTSVADGSILEEGDQDLPMLAPGSVWSGEVAFPIPEEDYQLTISILRPTGFSVTDRTYDARGNSIEGNE